MRLIILRTFLIFLLVITILLSHIPSSVLAVSDLPGGESPAPAESVPKDSDPTCNPPDTSEPDSSEPEPSESTASELESSEPESSELESSEPESSEPESSEPESSEPESSEPESSEPESSEPESSEPESSEPESSEPESSESEATIPSDAAPIQEENIHTGPDLYFGQLHAHTDLSNGPYSVQEVFSHAAQADGLDFFAVTDHSHSFDHQELAEIGTDASAYSADWAAGKAAALAVTGSDFVGIFGYEMSWPTQMKIGHISTFGTPGFQSWKQDPFNNYDGALDRYYQALSSVPGSVSQFNHPGFQYGTFSDFDYSEEADRAVTLMEIGSDGQDAYDCYIEALNLGWHLAPTYNQTNYLSSWDTIPTARTVVYAQSLTETAILDALRNYRVYATEDADLEIMYSMDGHFMGSQLDLRQIGERADLHVTLYDPTDSAVGTVEVITGGSQFVAPQVLSENYGTLSFSLAPESTYYFLRITQPDGDTAVTAPIWVDAEEELGICGLRCETAVPVQGEDIMLTLELHNRESADFLVDSLTVFADGIPVFTDNLTQIDANSALSRLLTFACDCVGATRITVKLEGSLEDCPRSYEASVDLSFHQSQEITSVLVDGSHGNAGLDQLKRLRQMAMAENIDLAISREEASAEELKHSRFLLISAPSVPFSDAFLASVREYAQYGGSLILCGQADSQDNGFHSAAELNRLLRAIGSTMSIQDDLAWDTVNNGGESSLLFPDRFNRGAAWCADISVNQVYRLSPGCTIDPGHGTWMVKGSFTTGSIDGDGDGLEGAPSAEVTLLASETLSGGGTVFAAGSLFLADSDLEEPRNIWAEPFANCTLAKTLLGIGGEAVPLSTIHEARSGAKNELFRVRGYVTAGTSNPYNTFPDTLYLQDDTGGIAVAPFSARSIQQGTPVEITGFAGTRNGNRILKVSSWAVLDTQMYQYEPLTGSWDTLLNPDLTGGSLVEVAGKCLEIYCREDDTLAGCLLKDDDGNLATVQIEDYIGNGSDGGNDLHKQIRKGRTVRAAGLLYINEYGDTVLRVRNCEEVVWVPPRHYFNPKTGDFLLPGPVFSMVFSLAGLFLLKKRKHI